MTEAVGFIVDRYRKLWRDYSRSIRITSVEALHDKHLWEQVKNFIEEFGAEFFHTPMLMVSNIRSILHVGADSFLDYLAEESDPLHPNVLIEAIEEGGIERESACQYLELIYECILEKLESFIEYNTTTTNSDYGDQLYCLLDFLRAEAAYDRDAWLLKPFRIAHEVLMETGNANAAALWEKQLRDTTQTKARKHLRKLSRLEKTYGIRLPSLSDHLDEQFVKTFAVDRMVALIPRALEELRGPGKAAVSFEALRTEIDRYLE